MGACASDDEAADMASPAAQDEASADSADAMAAGELEEGAQEGGAAEAAPETGGIAAAGLPGALDDREIITSVGLTMSTSDVRQAADDIRRVTATAGGFIFSSDVFLDEARDDGSVPGGGQIVIKVAPADLERLVTDLDGVGVVTQLSQDADDVTDQLVDLDIRIRQAEAGIARIELLLEEATVLDDVFAIENELNERTVDLERLRAAERNTENLVALATLTVEVEYRSPDALEEIAEPDDGIGDAFADGWGAFVGTIFALGYVLAITAPFLLTGLLILAIAWLLGRRWNRRHGDAREQRRLAADRRGEPGDRGHRSDDHSGRSMPADEPRTPPPPVPSQRVPEESTADDATERHQGDTLVTDDKTSATEAAETI